MGERGGFRMKRLISNLLNARSPVPSGHQDPKQTVEKQALIGDRTAKLRKSRSWCILAALPDASCIPNTKEIPMFVLQD